MRKGKVTGKIFGIALVFVMIASMLGGIGSAAPASNNDPPADTVHSLLATDEASETETEAIYQVTLITGDTVTVITAPDGKKNFAISPAEPEKLGQSFLIFEQHGDTYVMPDGVDLEKLDMELFNIDYLIEEDYHQESSLPLLVSYLPTLAESEVQSFGAKIRALGRETELHEGVHAVSTCLAYDNIASSYDGLVSQPEVEKIWLDKKVHATLNDSVPLIGASTWWDAGYNGTGVEIAILDTGVDSSHPALDDLDDNPTTNDPKVIVNVNFSDDPSFEDLNGHGTHVAGIAAGTAAGTEYQGVAPGAWLWNVKVLNQGDWGYDSWIIEGIDFASLGPDGEPGTGDEADIINLSLGGCTGSDGTDPLSQAVNMAVERGLVVVVAAGNRGIKLFTISTPGVAEKALTVGATYKGEDTTLIHWSGMGPTLDFRVKPDIVAPGVDIISSVPRGSYEAKSGTSMSTPHVAGAAALLLEKTDEEPPPGELPLPQFVKDNLMCAAKSIRVDWTFREANAYEQGSGRLDLTACWGADMLVTPASLSLGRFTSEETASGNFTFLGGSESHNITLTAELTDIRNGDDYSSNVSLEPHSFTLPAGGEISVDLNVDLASLPGSICSGKVVATVDEGASQSIHAIFGLNKLRELKVHKTDINGNPAQGHLVWFYQVENPFFVVMCGYKRTDEDGNVIFYVPDGIHCLVSARPGEDSWAIICTIEENVTVSGDMEIELDERDTKVIDFDPNKAGQIPCCTILSLYPCYIACIFSRYPSSFAIRMSPDSSVNAGFDYEYYPKEDFNADDPYWVNTDEWHHLRYSVTEITDDITFVADYDNLVRRNTSYCVALNAERALQFYWPSDDIIFHRTGGIIWGINAPQQRWEWLSPKPVEYLEEYFRCEPPQDWTFTQPYSFKALPWKPWRIGLSYPPGEHEWRIGCHPLTSGVQINYSDTRLHIWGPISVDPWDNAFENRQVEFSGHIKVTEDSEVVWEDDISDNFQKQVGYSDTDHFTVEVWGETPLDLSCSSYTKLEFTADFNAHSVPPKIWFFPVSPKTNLYSVIPTGNVKVAVLTEDDSEITQVELKYSLDDGDTWIDAGPPTIEYGHYVFDLGELEDAFVSLGVEAEDERGNSIYQETIKGFRVAATEEPCIAFSPIGLSFNATEGGTNPASQTLEIWNAGAGTLDWSVDDNATWLSLSPVSGSSTGEHDAVTVSVNISGMAAGDYNAVITISASGANNTLEMVPVDLSIHSQKSPPSVTTNAATNVEESTATLNGAITDTGGESCDYRGFVWGDESHGNPGNTAPASSGYDSNWTQSGSYGTGTFNHGIFSLSKGTKYYCRACARNSAGWSYGSEQSFLTKPDAPTSFSATTVSTTQIDLSWAKGDGAQKTKIQRKEGSYPANRDDGTQVYFDTGTSKPDTGLTPGTTYYYRAWSYVSGSEQWSDNYTQASATTTAIAAPTVTTNAASNITTNSATLNGNLSNLGSVSSVNVSFEWGTSFGDYPNETTPQAMNATGAFSFDLGELDPGIAYYFRAKAVGGCATSYGNDKSFTTVQLGDANGDGEVNMGDVTKVERIILTLDAETLGADANQDGEINMGDVTKIERIILGLD